MKKAGRKQRFPGAVPIHSVQSCSGTPRGPQRCPLFESPHLLPTRRRRLSKSFTFGQDIVPHGFSCREKRQESASQTQAPCAACPWPSPPSSIHLNWDHPLPGGLPGFTSSSLPWSCLPLSNWASLCSVSPPDARSPTAKSLSPPTVPALTSLGSLASILEAPRALHGWLPSVPLIHICLRTSGALLSLS